jgi:chromate transporter
MSTPSHVTFREAFRVWLKIGLLSFGGPAGQIALMHKMLVEERRWISESRFLHALNYCMLLPGPEAQQLATYIGWLLHRTAGGLMAGLLFILPGATLMLGLSLLYAGFRHLPAIDAVFFGIKATVLAIVVEAVVRVGRRALKSSLHVGIAAAAFVAIFFFAAPFPLIVLGAGLLGYALSHRGLLAARAPAAAAKDEIPAIVDGMFERGELEHTRPSWRRAVTAALLWGGLWVLPVVALYLLLGPSSVFVEESIFFSKAAMVTFGGAYSVLAYLAQQAVEVFGWLSPGEMLDGLGLAETTPGPLILVVQFVGFLGAFHDPGQLPPLLAGTLGAGITTWVTFAPCFLWIFLGAPYIEALRGHKALAAALAAITAAVVGVILNLSLWFALHTLFGEVREVSGFGMRLSWPTWSTVDGVALAIAVAAGVAMLRFHVGLIKVLAGGALLGLLWKLVLAA